MRVAGAPSHPVSLRLETCWASSQSVTVELRIVTSRQEGRKDCKYVYESFHVSAPFVPCENVDEGHKSSVTLFLFIILQRSPGY